MQCNTSASRNSCKYCLHPVVLQHTEELDDGLRYIIDCACSSYVYKNKRIFIYSTIQAFLTLNGVLDR